MPLFRPKSRIGNKARQQLKRRAGAKAKKRNDPLCRSALQIEIARTRAEAERAIAEANRSHARLRDAIDILPQGIVFLDSDGRYILWNKKYAELYGAAPYLFKVGRKLEETLRINVAAGVYPDAVGREEEWIAKRLEQLFHPRHRHEQKLADGRVILMEEQVTSDGGVIGLRVDITELKQREQSSRLLFESNPVPMLVCALDDEKILAANDAAVSHYGYERSAFEHMGVRNLQACGAEVPWTTESDGDALGGRVWKHVKADGSPIDVAIYSCRLTHDNRPAMLLALIDITERRRAEARLAFMSQHDSLTGLPNRAMLRDRLGGLLAGSRRSGRKVAVMCIDLDNFKSINDALGHDLGDKLLSDVARRLRSSLRDEDCLARLGANEFVVIQQDVDRPEDVVILAKRLLEVIGERFVIEGHTLVVSASVGIALAPGDGDDADKLLKNADLALSRTKAQARGTYSFFEPAMDARAQARRQMEVDLRAAIEERVLRPYYQPLIDLTSGRITGFEALVRWPHPARGMIPPSEFIPVAEETGLINALGGNILRHACNEAARWPSDISLAVNLSPLQFRTGNLLSVVMGALKQSGLPARRLELEITETLLMENSEHIIATLHALRALGVRMSMDDFGTGYSSLSYLRSFPIDKIKVDRSFVRDLAGSKDAQAIMRAIISLGRGLGVKVTAEGIETVDELACLREEGCHEGQGFLFSQARPQHDILDMLERQQAQWVA